MTDKATVELPSPVGGKIAKLGAEAGDVVAIGSDLVWIETDGVEAANAPVAEPTSTPAGAAQREQAELVAEPLPVEHDGDGTRHSRTPPRNHALPLPWPHPPCDAAPPTSASTSPPWPARGLTAGSSTAISTGCSATAARRPGATAHDDPNGGERRRRSDQGHRAAPQHRPADAGVDAADSPLHVRRGGRRHRRRTAARRAGPAVRGRPPRLTILPFC